MKGLPRSLAHAKADEATILGTPSGTGVSMTEQKFLGGEVRTVLLELDAVELALTDEAGVVAHAGLKVFTFPEGNILFLGATADLELVKDAAGVEDDFDGDFGLGTVVAGNNNALATTEQNFIPTTAILAATDTAPAQGKSTSTEAAKVHDGTTTPVPVFLNVLVDDDDHDVDGTATSLLATGTIKIKYIWLGDL